MRPVESRLSSHASLISDVHFSIGNRQSSPLLHVTHPEGVEVLRVIKFGTSTLSSNFHSTLREGHRLCYFVKSNEPFIFVTVFLRPDIGICGHLSLVRSTFSGIMIGIKFGWNIVTTQEYL